MRNIDRRLTAMAGQLGVCQDHWEARVCVRCDAEPMPMPAWAREGISTIMDHIIARLTQAEIRLAMSRVSPPTSELCPRCEGMRTCGACTTTYAKSLFREIQLTRAEDAALKSLMRKVRAFENR